jgi:hypothetical protein
MYFDWAEVQVDVSLRANGQVIVRKRSTESFESDTQESAATLNGQKAQDNHVQGGKITQESV